jgi:hypothetical protein
MGMALGKAARTTVSRPSPWFLTSNLSRFDGFCPDYFVKNLLPLAQEGTAQGEVCSVHPADAEEPVLSIGGSICERR